MNKINTKVLFLNPPHELPIMRRYMCSYYSPEYLLPPHDLISLATCIREWNKVEVIVVDAIAHKYTQENVIELISEIRPSIIVALMGIKVFGEDIIFLNHVKNNHPDIEIAVFGFYPTCFSDELLQKSCIDFVLRREPELPLSHLLHARETGERIEFIPGLAGREGNGAIFNNPEQRLQDIDNLPFPDPQLVDINLYEEAFLGGPCAAILSVRGCPFSCTYCTTTYGRMISVSSPERVIDEMEYLKINGAKVIRFLDDIFTFDKERVITICRMLIERNLKIPWTCLSRVDTIDTEMVDWMSRAGCVRIMVGIESYSKNVLNILSKGINPNTINQQLGIIKQSGIEILGFFMVGAPFESEDDYKMTVRGMLDSPIDYIIVNIVEPYASTAYFDTLPGKIEFNLIPFKCQYNDPEIYNIANMRRRKLYRYFYLRPTIILRHCHTFLRNPRRSLRLLATFLFFLRSNFSKTNQ